MNKLPLTSCKVRFSTFGILKLYDFFQESLRNGRSFLFRVSLSCGCLVGEGVATGYLKLISN